MCVLSLKPNLLEMDPFMLWPDGIPVMQSLSEPTPPTRKVALTRVVNIDSLCDAGCYNYGNKICTGCKATRYCSTECQRNSWNRHRPLCIGTGLAPMQDARPMEVTRTLHAGRSLTRQYCRNTYNAPPTMPRPRRNPSCGKAPSYPRGRLSA